MRAGCRVRLKYDRTDGAGPQRVIAQSAAQGRKFRRSRTITLTVGHLACRYGSGWTVVQRSDVATLAQRRSRSGDTVKTAWRGCLSGNGLPRDVVAIVSDETEDGIYMSAHLTLAGRWTLMSISQSYKESFEYLDIVDLATNRRARHVASMPDGVHLRGSAVNTSGVVAWVQQSETAPKASSIYVQSVTGAARAIREVAADITGLRLDADTVRWSEDGTEHSASIDP